MLTLFCNVCHVSRDYEVSLNVFVALELLNDSYFDYIFCICAFMTVSRMRCEFGI